MIFFLIIFQFQSKRVDGCVGGLRDSTFVLSAVKRRGQHKETRQRLNRSPREIVALFRGVRLSNRLHNQRVGEVEAGLKVGELKNIHICKKKT